MTHIYTFLKISFLGGGIDTKIFVDRIFGGLFFFGAKKATRKTSLLANRFTVKGHFSSPFHFILSTSQMRSGRGRCPTIICIFILLFSSSCMTHPGTQAFNGGISGREGHSVLGGTGWWKRDPGCLGSRCRGESWPRLSVTGQGAPPGGSGRSSKRCFAGPSKTLRNTQKKTFFLKSKGVSQDLPACAFSGHCRKTLGCQVLPNMLEEDVVKIRWKRPCH